VFGQTMLLEIGDSLRCLRSSREDGAVIILKQLEPLAKVLGVVRARVLRDAEFGTQEGAAYLGTLS
jgi:hypothetical protein